MNTVAELESAGLDLGALSSVVVVGLENSGGGGGWAPHVQDFG